MMKTINRSEINQALAKALAYADCGKFAESQRWGEVLIRKLELAGVFAVGDVIVTNRQVEYRELQARDKAIS